MQKHQPVAALRKKKNNLLTAYACQQAGEMQLGLLTAKTS